MSMRPSGVLEPLPLVVLRPGEMPVRQGEPCAGLWRVQTGLLCAAIVNEEGRELWLDVMGPGDVVGDAVGVTAAWSARALRPTRLVTARGTRGHDALADRTARLAAVVADLAWLDVPGRVERRLRDLADRFGRPVAGGVEIPFALRHDDLAPLAATTRESTSRAIRDLTEAGRIARVGRGRYVVRSPLRRVGG